MKTGELFPGVLAENTACVFLARLDPDNPVHWAKSIVGYANGRGGTLFVGVSDSGEASGIGIREIDRAKSLIAAVSGKGRKKLASPLPAKGFRDLLPGFLPKLWPLSKGTPEPDGAKQTGAAGKRYGHILKGRYGQPWLMP